MSTEAPAQTQAEQEQEQEHRSAILFISGLGGSTIEVVATRLGHALDRAAGVRPAKFSVLPGTNEANVAAGLTLERATIERKNPDESTARLDIWHLSTAGQLTDAYEQASLAAKLLRGARVVARYRRKLGLVFRRELTAKRPLERAQLWTVRAWIVLLAAYLVGLVVALLGEFASMDWVPDWLSAAVLAVTGLGIWQSKRIKLLTRSAIGLHGMLEYVGEGESVSAFRGQVADTLEHLATLDDVVYDQIDAVAYSFGSVVLLDALFPRADEPGRGFEQLETVVTIGCPCDLIRTYWPIYYTGRHKREGVPKRWINFYSPRDVFGSNFLSNDSQELGVQTRAGVSRPDTNLDWVVVPEDAEQVHWWQVVKLPGIKAHGHYWDNDVVQAESVYSPVVRELYAGKPLLA